MTSARRLHTGGGVIGIALLCAAAAAGEPGLLEAQAAAQRAAGGTAADDAGRTARLRRSHWAPVLRGELLRRDDLRSRVGELRGYPLQQQDAGVGNTWAITLTWDFAQLLYARGSRCPGKPTPERRGRRASPTCSRPPARSRPMRSSTSSSARRWTRGSSSPPPAAARRWSWRRKSWSSERRRPSSTPGCRPR